MLKKTKTQGSRERKGVFDSIFPREYDFELMLAEQVDRTLAGVDNLVRWLEVGLLSEPVLLDKMAEEVDEMRHDLEDRMISAFSTPYDRQDIYSLSRQMDYILNFSRETANEMYAFGVYPDKHILAMATALLHGTECLAEGVKIMKSDRIRSEAIIRKARKYMHEIEEIYINGMKELLNTDNAMNAMSRREIYHHLRDAGRALRDTADIMHRALVGLS